jgi:hypothetical protein
MRRRIPDPQLRAWLWLLPVWLAFMFVFGILIETRVFGELIPLVVCATTLILEQLLLARIASPQTAEPAEPLPKALPATAADPAPVLVTAA